MGEILIGLDSPESKRTVISPGRNTKSPLVAVTELDVYDADLVNGSPVKRESKEPSEGNNAAPFPLVKQPPASANNRQVYKFAAVIIGSYFGVFARVLLTAASDLNEEIKSLGSGYLLPNVIGCYVMGVMVKLSDRFAKYPLVAVGITSGFCGCCTTFATWEAKVVQIMTRTRWTTAAIHVVVTFALSQAGFTLGTHSAVLVEEAIKRLKATATKGSQSKNDVKKGALLCEKLKPVLIWTLVGALNGICWLLAFVDPSLDRQKWWIACCFGPVGASLRYWLSLYNTRVPNIPLFTFLPNVTAATINVILYMGGAQIADDHGKDSNVFHNYHFWVLAGISTGLMGSLSTVSTWINELNKLAVRNLWYAYRYGLVTFFVAQVLSWLVVAIWTAAAQKFRSF